MIDRVDEFFGTAPEGDVADQWQPGHLPPSAGAGTRSGSTTPVASPSQLQHTLAQPAIVTGIGLFHGKPVTCTILPAPVNHGLVFERIDTPEPVRIPALITNIAEKERRTALRVGDVFVETCEHCLSALAGLRVDNALIRLDGPEPPCGDGSAEIFVEAILKAGIEVQDMPRRVYRVTETITVSEGDSMLVAAPGDAADLQVLYNLDYGAESPILPQLHAFTLNGTKEYVRQIAPSRTFSLEAEARALWERGYCKHLTPRDVLVIGPDGPIENTFKFDNEPVRHKILDLIGDLSLLGREIHGRIIAYRSGHALNHRLVQRIMERIRAKEQIDASDRWQLDIRGILKLLRHRYPMLLVDRVVEIDGDRRAVGIKNVTINEPFFQGHYPGTPIMPGVLIVEAMAQLSGLLVSRVLEHTGKVAVMLSLDRVKLRRPVVPGDQLVMEAETVHAQGRTANVRCRAFVAGQVAAEAQIKFLMVDAEED